MEVASALIKAVRRGHEPESLYWALELESYPHFLFKRLAILACEDVGLADPSAIGLVTSCWTAWERIHARTAKGRIVDRDLIGLAVLGLCRSAKSKEVDAAMNMVVERRERGWHLEVPPEALDLHTQRGRAMGKTVVDWWQDTAWLPPGGHGKYAGYADLKAAGGDLEPEQP